MRVPFVKMNGAGNDFVMIDNLAGQWKLDEQAIRHLCDRRRGVGADGLITIDPAEGFDFAMVYYNSDGRRASMCGNGARCAARFAAQLGLGRDEKGRRVLDFAADATPVRAWVEGSRVAVALGEAEGLELHRRLPVERGYELVHLIDTGVPHAVIREPEVETMTEEQLELRARAIRFHRELEPRGANVDFAAPAPDGTIRMRTYERGVEGETLACGTGAVAVAVVFAHLGWAESPVRLRTRGGDLLEVAFVKKPYGASEVILEGPAEVNFRGQVEI